MSEVIDRTETPRDAARRLSEPAQRDGFKPEALHAYSSASGEPIFWRIRLKHPDTGAKWIRPMRRTADDAGYEIGEPPAPPAGKPLYNLHRIAADPAAVIFVTEGEKAADALGKLGCVATTSGGASSASAADWTPLQGRDALIWPDADEPGAQYGRDVATRLVALNCKVRIIDVAALGLPAKGDAFDWRAAHPEATAADVLALPMLPSSEPQEAEPAPLPGELLPVEPFDYASLPDALRPWVADIVQRVSCPPDFVAVPVMVALGAVIGRKIAVRPQQFTDWTVIPNLWGLVIGRPGAMKSPAMSQATAPLKRLAARAQDQYEAAMRDWKQSQKLRDLQDEAGQKKARALLAKDPGANVMHLIDGGADDPEPLLRRYTTANATPEALGELLRQNPQGMLLERDELMGLLRDLDRPDKADHRAFLLEAWDGSGSFTFDRIGRGFNLHIPHLCLSIIGTTQPGRIREYLSDALHGGAGDDGLMQRFSMMVWPDQTGEWIDVDHWPDGAAKKAAWAVFDRLDTLDPQAIGAMQDTDLDGNPEGTPYLRLSEDALALFVQWRTELEARLRSGELHPALESHLSKYRKLVPALALICHLADDGRGPVSDTAMLRALGWAAYLESHARRIYGGAVSPEVEAARAILRRIKKGDLPRDGFKSWDVWRPNWSGLSDRDLVSAALAYLVDMGWLHERREPTAGRPSTTYTLNGRAKL
ncbi:MAG: DUF3987 domain-containing protein [Thiomonas arsenitoxydans]|jgi:hypothetical protein|uniref:DUF3987 domain-containing protein n=1 Tax=Thiomonas arsenitoxydans (strain DSM 22701 / CIP 110005 / 3As) TaxID=426114 RepID=A0A8I1MZF1_THIA3|nr:MULTISPECIES: DUF3987 domain-containing protein [Thiomonas]MBN8744797.1 DUF3987 domain-containing protein [Thiomonas arsenitoxydans]ODU95573.1 MAG: hypothetical protein ABT24_11600 [Thiomonas sp. SCN 64-16]